MSQVDGEGQPKQVSTFQLQQAEAPFAANLVLQKTAARNQLDFFRQALDPQLLVLVVAFKYFLLLLLR